MRKGDIVLERKKEREREIGRERKVEIVRKRRSETERVEERDE